jgi:hypothetical protein
MVIFRGNHDEKSLRENEYRISRMFSSLSRGQRRVNE